MNFNPLIGRYYPSPDETESIDPDPKLTIAIVVLCIMAPFWLIYRLFEYLTTRVRLITRRAMRQLR